MDISLLNNGKKAFKLASQAIFGIAKSLYLFYTSHLSQKFQFFARNCQMVTCMHNQRYTCHHDSHEANLTLVNSFNNIPLK